MDSTAESTFPSDLAAVTLGPWEPHASLNPLVDLSGLQNTNVTFDPGPNWPRNSTVNSTSATGFGAEVMIPMYSVIFLLSVVGNVLVIVTLAQNRRMRTVTNVFLLNLAVADLLLGVFCMPFTLVGQLLRDFIFGSFMCKIIPFFQAVSVSVGVWTLVAISLERYFAICRPLRSRIWQTRSHAYKMIMAVWTVSLCWCLPAAVLNNLKPIRGTNRQKCREEWPDRYTEQAYNLFLVGVLLVVPLLVMALAYWLIAAKLWKGLRRETHGSSNNKNTRTQPLLNNPRSQTGSLNHGRYSPQCTAETNESSSRNTTGCPCGSSGSSAGSCGSRAVVIQWPSRSNHRRLCCQPHQPRSSSRRDAGRNGPSVQIMDYQMAARNGVRSTYTDKSVLAKKKVIRMLFVIVLEFFVCWTPLYVINTWYVFDPAGLYERIGSLEISLIQLIAYLSSCCNPITYCFMNEKFRNAFLNAFGCRKRFPATTPNRSTDVVSGSINESLTTQRRSLKGQRDRHFVLMLQETNV